MDRRKLKFKNTVLHKQLHSVSQTNEKTTTVPVKNVFRSVSAVANISLSRKRKISNEEEKDESDNDSMQTSPPINYVNDRKKRRISPDDENSNNSSSAETFVRNKNVKDDHFSRLKDVKKKQRVDTDDDNNSEREETSSKPSISSARNENVKDKFSRLKINDKTNKQVDDDRDDSDYLVEKSPEPLPSSLRNETLSKLSKLKNATINKKKKRITDDDSDSRMETSSDSSTSSISDKKIKNNKFSKLKNVSNAKKKRIDNEENSNERIETSPEPSSSSIRNKNVKVTNRRKKVIDDDDDDNDVNYEEETSKSSTSSIHNNKIQGNKGPKFKALSKSNNLKKHSNELGKDVNHPTSSGSYFKEVFEAIDRSPAKLSQSSTSSIEKYRKMNLRTPVHSRFQRPISRTIAEKKKEKLKQNQKAKVTESINSNDSSLNAPSKKKSDSDVSKENLNSSISNKLDTSASGNDNELNSSAHTFNEPLVSDLHTTPVKKSILAKGGSPHRISRANSTVKDIEASQFQNKRARVIASPELSPLKDFQSPKEKRNLTQGKNICYKEDKFINFINTAGVTLLTGDNLHIIDNNARVVIKKMKGLLDKNDIEINEILQSWNNYIEDEENLRKSLLEIKVETSEGARVCAKTMSLARLLLNVPQLQVPIMHSLFKRLIDIVIATDSPEDATWAFQILQQFRFMEVVMNPDTLFELLKELIMSSPEWFQREVIIFLPDIIVDSQHRMIAEMLVKLMENNTDLISIVLDCIYNLTLSDVYTEELREKVLELLGKQDLDKSSVPAIAKFILTSCPKDTIALKSLNVLRFVDMSPSPKENVEECYTNQMFLITAIKLNIQLFKEVKQAALTFIKDATTDAVPLHFIITILYYELIEAKQKVVETAMNNHIKSGRYNANLIKLVYTGYKNVVNNFQSTALIIAIGLLKAEKPVLVEFGIEWLRSMFTSQSNTIYKQREIMEALLHLMGSKDKTVKNVLEVLCRMANDDKERRYFDHHSAFLQIFLEKVDRLQFSEVATLYHLLHSLCTDSESISNALNDDLSIIMQKQLCSPKLMNKCKGVLGAVMAIKHLAKDNETSNEAFDLLKRTLISLKNCAKSRALFYDKLGQVIASESNINKEFLSNITIYFEEDFENTCLLENNTSINLEPKFGLNDSTIAENYMVIFGNSETGSLVPIFFKLICICNMQLSGNLESINAILGCPILLPIDLDIPDPTTCNYMIHCINWFREIINGFVTQEETLLREQVLNRLGSLMAIQGEFAMMYSMCGSLYQPPPCYYHEFPIPNFMKIDSKIGKKKGRKTKQKKDKEESEGNNTNVTHSKSIVTLPEWENWEFGSDLAIKNPMYFRRMDTKIIYLLDTHMDSSEQSTQSVSIAQVCFILKELLSIIENHISENFIRDIIPLLPKLCTRFKSIAADLRETENSHKKYAMRLFLCLLNAIFNWTEFQHNKYNTLLRDGLRALAGMASESNALLRSCKDLVAESYKYFESLADIATQISLAVAFVNMCGCLMKHSNSFTEESRDRQAKMAYGFLCLEWNDDSHGPQYKLAIKALLKTWMDNETDPLKIVLLVLEWLPEQSAALQQPQSRLTRLPSISKVNLPLLLKQLFEGLVKGTHISLDSTERDPQRIQVWLEVAVSLDKIANICKEKKHSTYLILFVRYSAIMYQLLFTLGMPLLEVNIKYQTDEVLSIIKLFQKCGRFLRDIFCTARKDNNLPLLKIIPLCKARREKFIYMVKGILTANNSIEAFWMGNLLNKDLDGEEITSESTDDITASSELTTELTNANDSGSEIFNSGSEAETVDEERENEE